MEGWIKVVGVFVLVFFFAFLFIGCTALLYAPSTPTGGNVAVIPVHGVITLQETGGFSRGFDAAFLKTSLEEAEADPDIKAILIDINSPGGSAVASDEIGQLIKASEKPTVAWVREVGASGGYWIASTADHIIANRMSITGSIGVVGSYLDFSGLLTDYNVTYQRLVSGPYKDSGSPFKALSAEERNMLQSKINLIHDFFVQEVAQNRGLSIEDVAGLASGEIYLGVEAKELGLIDELGSDKEVKAYLQEVLGEEPEYRAYQKQASVLDVLYGLKIPVDLGIKEPLSPVELR